MSARQGGLWLASLALGALCAGSPATAADGSGTVPGLFRGANPAQGEKLYSEMKCAACHAERMMGSTSAMYTRPDRKVHNARELRDFTQMCVSRLNRSLFPEEVTDIAAYLNQTYYHFRQ